MVRIDTETFLNAINARETEANIEVNYIEVNLQRKVTMSKYNLPKALEVNLGTMSNISTKLKQNIASCRRI